MRTLVFITQSADPAHPVLGATLPKIRALAERVDEVVVLADTVVPEALPENCRARSFAASSQAGRGARLLAALAPELTRRPVAVVAHMAPVYALHRGAARAADARPAAALVHAAGAAARCSTPRSASSTPC